MSHALKVIAGPPASEESLQKLGIKYTPTEDHKTYLCSVCQNYMWVGPRQQAEYHKDSAHCELVCFICLASHLNRMPDIQHLGGNSGKYEKLEDE